jgi:hypothetical protein
MPRVLKVYVDNFIYIFLNAYKGSSLEIISKHVFQPVTQVNTNSEIFSGDHPCDTVSRTLEIKSTFTRLITQEDLIAFIHCGYFKTYEVT